MILQEGVFLCVKLFFYSMKSIVYYCSKNIRVCIVLEHPVLDYIGIVFLNLKNVNRLELLHDALMLDCI